MRANTAVLLLALVLGTPPAAQADEYSPDLQRIRAGLQRVPEPIAAAPEQPTPVENVRSQATIVKRRDSV